MLGLTAEEIREALRRRYPATIQYGSSHAPGVWTTLTEWMQIDLLALCAWRNPPSGATVPHPIIGHEIKVSRADYRRELRAPHKRALAVAFTTQFYFAVPDGLLKPDEIAWTPEPWLLDHDAWQRKPCPASYQGGYRHHSNPAPCDKGKRSVPAHGPLRRHQRYRDLVSVRCDECGGRGYLERSRVEREAPTLWIPADVGLIVVTGGVAKVARKAPIRPGAPARTMLLGIADDTSPEHRRAQITEFARWVSVRPDPRHRAVRGDIPPS